MEVGAARLEDRLGTDEPPYRSRGEAQIGRLLDRYGIPFLYEHPLVLWDRGWLRRYWPDFILPTYGNLIVEYAGMPDRIEYMARLERRRAAYEANGVKALILYPKDLMGPRWPRNAIQGIEQAYMRSAPVARYRGTSATAPARCGGYLSPSRCAYRR